MVAVIDEFAAYRHIEPNALGSEIVIQYAEQLEVAATPSSLHQLQARQFELFGSALKMSNACEVLLLSLARRTRIRIEKGSRVLKRPADFVVRTVLFDGLAQEMCAEDYRPN
jgi:hypothetical protein